MQLVFFPFDTKDSISPEVACAMKRYISLQEHNFIKNRNEKFQDYQ